MSTQLVSLFNALHVFMTDGMIPQIGFSIGGIARRFLVSPPSMIWPANLVTCTLFNTLHSQEYAGIGNHGGISREKFFLFAFLGSFSWYFLPGYLFQG